MFDYLVPLSLLPSGPPTFKQKCALFSPVPVGVLLLCFSTTLP